MIRNEKDFDTTYFFEKLGQIQIRRRESLKE